MSAGSVEEILTALANAAGAITSLRPFPYRPAELVGSMVCAVLSSDPMADFTVIQGVTVVDYHLRLELWIPFEDVRAAQLELYGYLNRSGSTSINAAVAADPTLGGKVDYCILRSAGEITETMYGAVPALMVPFNFVASVS